MMNDIASMGGELFVMDDGWFGGKYRRINDNSSLGDWVVDTEKLPHGINMPTYHYIGTVPYPYMTGVTFNQNTQYCPTTIGTSLIKHFLYRTVPSLAALRHAKSRTDF